MKSIFKNRTVFLLLTLLILIMLTACGGEKSPLGDELSGYQVVVRGDGVEKTYTVGEMFAWENSVFQGAYSTTNNWPASSFYAVEGIRVSVILEQSGLYESAKQITFVSPDGYKCSFTREQLLGTERYYFPGLMEESAEGAMPVEAVLAYSYIIGSSDLMGLSLARRQSVDLIFGQANVFEHTNVGFVSHIMQIMVSSDEPETWKAPTTYPLDGPIRKGSTVKFEHPDLNGGYAKLFYTLDGSEPDEFSSMYNPSTYQPELTVPITINETTVVKVKVIGLGKKDSETRTFQFTVQ